MKFKFILLLLCFAINFSLLAQDPSYPPAKHNLIFDELAQVWDEAIPLGNGMLGCLVWQKEGKLRFSLDRADLWDLRPMENIDFTKWTFRDVYNRWKEGKYKEVQDVFDVPYDQLAAPSKIPAGALEFDVKSLGQVSSVSLHLDAAFCEVIWENGTKLRVFVHADRPVGWYSFENLDQPVEIKMIPPAYNRVGSGDYTAQSKNDLNKLGYDLGQVKKKGKSITYDQKGWGDFSYQIHTRWKLGKESMTGTWSVSSKDDESVKTVLSKESVKKEIKLGFENSFDSHKDWWSDYWKKSSIEIPNELLAKQYSLEMYKFGSAARSDAPPIALQSVWTADHGLLPPWKGDFHHDLNTQLSYWPAYAGNQLDLEEGFINWLWKYRDTFRKYTRDYFGVEGMNVPGVTTLKGEPMGGWIQYSMGSTIASWLSHHFYLHWQYTMDREFLKHKAYPWIKEVAIFLDQISVKDEQGMRKLPMSSSPEIYNNSAEAWFDETTNYDLALIRWTYQKAAELAFELGLNEDAANWENIMSEWPELSVDANSGLMFKPGLPYNESHRHFSHLMAYHPLGLLDFSNGEKDKEIIQNTLRNLQEQGTGGWTGYSFSWQGNLYARAFDGENAERVLEIFSECFCLKNSFHVNGDQCRAGHSNMTYRPFTLEGNFAFASAIQEMLIQSHTGIVKLFPAIPKSWSSASFKQLRTNGAFLISAELMDGSVSVVNIFSEMGGELNLQNPFDGNSFVLDHPYELKDGVINLKLEKGSSIKIISN